jgi:hypothetical protein
MPAPKKGKGRKKKNIDKIKTNGNVANSQMSETGVEVASVDGDNEIEESESPSLVWWH